MTDFDKLILERDAYRYWLGLMLIHAGTGFKASRERIEGHLKSLKNGEPIERLNDDMPASVWDEENFRRYPVYEAIALEILERLVAFERSGKVEDLALDV